MPIFQNQSDMCRFARCFGFNQSKSETII